MDRNNGWSNICRFYSILYFPQLLLRNEWCTELICIFVYSVPFTEYVFRALEVPVVGCVVFFCYCSSCCSDEVIMKPVMIRQYWWWRCYLLLLFLLDSRLRPSGDVVRIDDVGTSPSNSPNDWNIPIVRVHKFLLETKSWWVPTMEPEKVWRPPRMARLKPKETGMEHWWVTVMVLLYIDSRMDTRYNFPPDHKQRLGCKLNWAFPDRVAKWKVLARC